MVEWTAQDRAVIATGAGPTYQRVSELSARLVEWSKADAPRFEAFQRVAQRVLGITRIGMSVFRAVPDPLTPGRLMEFVSPVLDGEDLGDLADGTLRALEIVAALQSDAGMVIIEEPELGIHPGLVSKLLAEIESVSDEKQIVLTTHSPQVVSRFPPTALRLVQRIDGKFQVSELDAAQQDHVRRFLEEDGTLGEYVFQGPLGD
jgi:predicted ATPase